MEAEGASGAHSTPEEHSGSPRHIGILETLPLMNSVLGHGSVRRVMELSVLNAATLLEGRVDPNLAALDQAIPTWVIRKAKARAPARGRVGG